MLHEAEQVEAVRHALMKVLNMEEQKLDQSRIGLPRSGITTQRKEKVIEVNCFTFNLYIVMIVHAIESHICSYRFP